MPPIDAASIAALRATLAGARTRPDPQRLTAVMAVLDDLLAALAENPPVLTVDPLGGITLRAAQKITLTTGLASLTLGVQGDISLKGNSVSVKTTTDVPIGGSKLRDENTYRVSGTKIGSN